MSILVRVGWGVLGIIGLEVDGSIGLGIEGVALGAGVEKPNC